MALVALWAAREMRAPSAGSCSVNEGYLCVTEHAFMATAAPRAGSYAELCAHERV